MPSPKKSSGKRCPPPFQQGIVQPSGVANGSHDKSGTPGHQRKGTNIAGNLKRCLRWTYVSEPVRRDSWTNFPSCGKIAFVSSAQCGPVRKIVGRAQIPNAGNGTRARKGASSESRSFFWNMRIRLRMAFLGRFCLEKPPAAWQESIPRAQLGRTESPPRLQSKTPGHLRKRKVATEYLQKSSWEPLLYPRVCRAMPKTAECDDILLFTMNSAAHPPLPKRTRGGQGRVWIWDTFAAHGAALQDKGTAKTRSGHNSAPGGAICDAA